MKDPDTDEGYVKGNKGLSLQIIMVFVGIVHETVFFQTDMLIMDVLVISGAYMNCLSSVISGIFC